MKTCKPKPQFCLIKQEIAFALKANGKNKIHVLSCFKHLEMTKCAASCGFQQYGILTSVDSDESVQPPFKLSQSKLCSISSLTLINIQATIKGSDLRLVAHTILLEISCQGLNVFRF